MKLKHFTVKVLVAALVSLTIVFELPAFAAGNYSNQDINQPALLVAPDPDFKIPVYLKPAASERRVGYGSGGDAVTVVEQVGSNEGSVWNYVKFDRPPYTAGWIQEEYIAPQAGDHMNPSAQKSSRGNRYPDQSRQNGSQNSDWQFRQ